MGIKAKILIPTLALTLLVAAAILISNIALFSGHVRDTSLDNLQVSASVAMDRLEALKSDATVAAAGMARDPDIISALQRNDRDALRAQASLLQTETKMEFCTITDPAGTVVLRTHEPENSGDSVASQANVQSAMAGLSLTAVEQGSAVRLSVRAGAPVYGGGGAIIGIVSVGSRLDTEQFVDGIKALLKCEATVFLGDERISTTILGEDGKRFIGTKANPDVAAQVLAGTTNIGEVQLAGRSALGHYDPIAGPDGQILGMLFVGQYTDASEQTVRAFVQSALLITLLMLAISAAVILIIARRITAPIHTMVEAASTLALGDTDVDIRVNTKDEMRTLAEAFSHMIEGTRRQAQVIEHISGGDLSVSVQSRSKRDLMNNALIDMLNMNNEVFHNITGAAGQVALGSQQIANSSHALAQGSTEQAASIVELSDSVADITQKIKANAEMAENTAKLAGTIRGYAEKSNRQMEEMIGAVKEINQSSQNISKVIKVIDDIAFQTNILALNAAVEAARAGQHGKGFAVVAEEVRNLASKSAEAAKETGSMIQDSMSKAELGSRIAQDTAASLSEIIAGINDSNALIDRIAHSSEEQAQGISHINVGIDQIAQVVQQNSATAEENAAASQEMSSQSSLLQTLIAKFKLREREY